MLLPRKLEAQLNRPNGHVCFFSVYGSAPISVLVIIGTRPEAIKLAPLVEAMRQRPAAFEVRVCLTGQHRDLIEDVLPAFGIEADDNLAIMQPGQSLCDTAGRLLTLVQHIFRKWSPDLVIVQGDTSTAFCGALAAFYSGIPVAHIEAGLRTGNPHNPFPEEVNRVLVSRVASFHFAATCDAAKNLYGEGVPEECVWVTGNTGLDAVRLLSERLTTGQVQVAFPFSLDPKRKLVLVTAHRRENMPDGLQGIGTAVARLAQRPDVQIVFPLHPNPEVRRIVHPMLSNCSHVHLTPPLEYRAFIDLMRRAYVILSDSGGIQEEAPALGIPVLVLRDTTERPEAVAAGAARLVGTQPERILLAATELLDNAEAYAAMAQRRRIYGDGEASGRICSTLAQLFSDTRDSRLKAVSA